MSVRRFLQRALATTGATIALIGVSGERAISQQVDSARAAAARPANTQPTAQDTARPPISPRRAFLYSLLLPGYGQSVLDRPIAGGMFFAAEVTWIALATKSAFDLRYARAHERDSLITSYRVKDGVVERDSLGFPIGATFAPNRYATERVAARRKHLEDYYALLIANHLLAGAEAFVAAQLWDLQAHVSIKQMPFGHALVATFRW